ncbi:MAG: exodeoxyribonuclease VII small subunit [Bacteroidaceae bacterium]|nr:exodeoxyribonuclease VII small subunit [Bacteroidaceae bacterium]
MKKKETYAQSIQRLEQIVQQIDNGELDIDELAEKIKEAKAIIAFCTEKLTHVDKQVEILLSDGQ